jgi:hypothetical protein
MSNKKDSISILIATTGRPTLLRLLDSLKYQLNENDFIYVVVDGAEYREKVDEILEQFTGYKCNLEVRYEEKNLGFWGHSIRNKHQGSLKGDYILHADDDDAYTLCAMDFVRAGIAENPGKMLLFKMCDNTYINRAWIIESIRHDNIGTPCGVIPNLPEKMGHWEETYGGDCDFYLSCKFEHVFINKIIYVLRPVNYINIDNLYYINLDKRQDRRDHIQSVISRINIKRAERVVAFDTPENGSYGCALSHIHILEDAIEKNYDNILILEDDFKPHDHVRLNIELFRSFNQFVFDYDVLTLSPSTWVNYHEGQSASPEQSDLLRVSGAQTTSGYCVNKRFFNTLLNSFKESALMLKDNEERKVHWAIDQHWKALQHTHSFFAFRQNIGRQLEGFSDIERVCVDYGD